MYATPIKGPEQTPSRKRQRFDDESTSTRSVPRSATKRAAIRESKQQEGAFLKELVANMIDETADPGHDCFKQISQNYETFYVDIKSSMPGFVANLESDDQNVKSNAYAKYNTLRDCVKGARRIRMWLPRYLENEIYEKNESLKDLMRKQVDDRAAIEAKKADIMNREDTIAATHAEIDRLEELKVITKSSEQCQIERKINEVENDLNTVDSLVAQNQAPPHAAAQVNPPQGFVYHAPPQAAAQVNPPQGFVFDAPPQAAAQVNPPQGLHHTVFHAPSQASGQNPSQGSQHNGGFLFALPQQAAAPTDASTASQMDMDE